MRFGITIVSVCQLKMWKQQSWNLLQMWKSNAISDHYHLKTGFSAQLSSLWRHKNQLSSFRNCTQLPRKNLPKSLKFPSPSGPSNTRKNKTIQLSLFRSNSMSSRRTVSTLWLWSNVPESPSLTTKCGLSSVKNSRSKHKKHEQRHLSHALT